MCHKQLQCSLSPLRPYAVQRTNGNSLAFETCIKILDSCLPVNLPWQWGWYCFYRFKIKVLSWWSVFSCIFGLKNIISLNFSIVRKESKGLFIHSIPQSVLIRMIHFHSFGVICSFVKAYTSKTTPITPNWEVLFSLSLPSFLFLFTSQSGYL